MGNGFLVIDEKNALACARTGKDERRTQLFFSTMVGRVLKLAFGGAKPNAFSFHPTFIIPRTESGGELRIPFATSLI